MQKLLIATQNQGKVAEFADMMNDLAVEWIGLADLGITTDVVEDGTTFEANAILKAQAYAREAGYLTLADDSGLEVEALNGEPGLYTARYGGPGLTHADRYNLLLSNLKKADSRSRRAQFRCVIVVAAADGEILRTVEGICPGEIAVTPRGSHGFGYDPVFVPDGFDGKTMAELLPKQKHPISHRGRAIAELAPFIRQLINE